MATATAQLLAEAAAKRHVNSDVGTSTAQLEQEHEKRQHFRRLIDPGIFRPNSKPVAMDALKASLIQLPCIRARADSLRHVGTP